MPVDTSIILGVKPLQLPDTSGNASKFLQMQGLMNQNALAQYQLSSAKRTDENANALARVWAESIDPSTGLPDQNKLVRGLATNNLGGQIPDTLKKFQEADTAKVTNQKLKGEVIDQTMGRIQEMYGKVKTPEEYIAVHNYAHTDPTIGPILKSLGVDRDKQLADITQKLSTPEGFAELKATSSLKAKEFADLAKENFHSVDNGSSISVYSKSGVPGTPMKLLATIPKTQTPDATSRDAILIRGQNMVDARSRERLAAETATGQLTPETKDFLAQTYVQTGQLPPMGMGKGAAQMRSEVLTRAAEIATGGGKTAEQAAADVRAGKADTAAVAKSVKDFATGIQGRQVNAFNTAIDHLDTMTKLSDALNNGDIKAINAIGNVIAEQTGKPAPTNFDTAKQIVTAEVIKAVVASGGGVTERQEAERKFATAKSPDQLKGAIDTYKQLLGGQLKSLNLQYENTTGRKDFNKKLTPAAQSELSRLRSESPAPAPAPAASGKWEIVK